MNSIDELNETWAKDVTIDTTELTAELAKIPTLHSKYLKILSYHNLMIKKLSMDYAKAKRIKWEYYNGDLNNPEDLSKYNLPPMSKKILRQDIPVYLDSDPELVNILTKKMLHQEMADQCTSIMKELTNRTFQIGHMIKWEQFINGVR